MIYLILCIVLTSLLGIIFKQFESYGVDNKIAIIWNYIACIAIGYLQLGSQALDFSQNTLTHCYTLALGLFFILGFNLFAKTIFHYGIGMASLSQKMSIVLSVSFTILFLGEDLSIVKSLGLLFAIIAILLASSFISSNQHIKSIIILPVGAWLCSGLIEVFFILIKHNDPGFFANPELLAMRIFLYAAIFGFLHTLYNQKHHAMFHSKNIVSGVILGVPNFFSIITFVLALQHLSGSVVYPILNCGVILLAVLIGKLYYKEAFNTHKWLSLIAACIAIWLISIS